MLKLWRLCWGSLDLVKRVTLAKCIVNLCVNLIKIDDLILLGGYQYFVLLIALNSLHDLLLHERGKSSTEHNQLFLVLNPLPIIMSVPKGLLTVIQILQIERLVKSRRLPLLQYISRGWRVELTALFILFTAFLLPSLSFLFESLLAVLSQPGVPVVSLHLGSFSLSVLRLLLFLYRYSLLLLLLEFLLLLLLPFKPLFFFFFLLFVMCVVCFPCRYVVWGLLDCYRVRKVLRPAWLVGLVSGLGLVFHPCRLICLIRRWACLIRRRTCLIRRWTCLINLRLLFVFHPCRYIWRLVVAWLIVCVIFHPCRLVGCLASIVLILLFFHPWWGRLLLSWWKLTDWAAIITNCTVILALICNHLLFPWVILGHFNRM